MNYEVKTITYEECKEWLLFKHYAKRMCSISYSFGLFDGLECVGVCTFGKPASNYLCVGVCGEDYTDKVYELNRLVVNDGLKKNSLSWFVSRCLSLLPELIIVSYADTKMNHHGYIYQATNWYYTGLSAKAIDKKIIGSDKHGRHNNAYEKDGEYELIERSRKHRYIYFTKNKKKWLSRLNYKIESYPKGDNKRYDASFKPNTQTKLF